MVREDTFEMGDIVIHEFRLGLYEITFADGRDTVTVTNDSAETEYEVSIDNLIMVCPAERRLDT